MEFGQKFFLHLLRGLYYIYSSICYYCISIDWFAETEILFHLWEKSHLIMVYDPFNELLNLFC